MCQLATGARQWELESTLAILGDSVLADRARRIDRFLSDRERRYVNGFMVEIDPDSRSFAGFTVRDGEHVPTIVLSSDDSSKSDDDADGSADGAASRSGQFTDDH